MTHELPAETILALALVNNGDDPPTVEQWSEGEWSQADIPPYMLEQITTILGMSAE